MRKSRLSRYKQNKLIELFVAGVTARTAAELVGVNKNTAAYYFHRLRLLIYQNSPHLEMFDGEVEADESYFGGQRKGKRGRGAAGKVAVFGLLKREMVRFIRLQYRIQTATLFPIIREQVKPDSIVYTDCYRSYDVLDV
ncbi:IS1595 family transposase, partial [Neisseria meningitidis]